MANPLDSLKNLKPWQQGAVAVGGIGVVVLVVWQREKAKKTAATVPVTPPTATAAATSDTAGEIEDPTTGTYYPDTSDDPETGLTYQQEITGAREQLQAAFRRAARQSPSGPPPANIKGGSNISTPDSVQRI